MPPLRPVHCLKVLCVDALAATITTAFVRAAGGGTSSTRTRRRVAGKKKAATTTGAVPRPLVSRPAEGVLTSSPSCQVSRVKQYLGQGVPKARRESLLHQVLLQIAEVMTRLPKSKCSSLGREESGFEVRVQRLQQALSHALETLLDSSVSRLDLTPLQHQIIKWVSSCKLNNRNPKEAPSIDTVRVENMLITVFGKHALKLASLTTLLWPHLVTGEVIKVIGSHCRSLRRLELACTCDATSAMNYVKEDPAFARQEKVLVNSLGALYDRAPGDFSGVKPAGCPLLQKLVLPRLDDEDGSLASHVARALCSLDSLESVTGAPMLVSLEKLRNDRDAPRSLRLKHLSDIDTYNRRPMPDVSHLTALVPHLQSVELIVSEGITRAVTESFLNLSSLSIALTDFHLSVRRFKNLHTLDINLEFQTAWPLLLALSRGRIQLKSLSLRQPTFRVGQEESEAASASLRLPTLLSFTLVRSSFIEFSALRSLASGTPNLTSLSVTLSDDRNYTVDEFTDDLVCSVAPLLPALRSFTAECQYKNNLYNQPNCLLTMASVDALCRHCPELRFLGHLDVWDLDDQDVKHLSERVAANNWDLQVAS